MVGLPTSVPSSGDVPLLLRETPTPKCSYLTEAVANIQQIQKTTKKVISKLTKYKNKSEYFVDYNRTIDEILNSIYKLFGNYILLDPLPMQIYKIILYSNCRVQDYLFMLVIISLLFLE